MWLILATVALAGFLQGIAVGVVAAVMLIVLSCSHTDVVKHAIPGGSYRSRVNRGMNERRFLHERGDAMLIIQFRGFVFFGTTTGLAERVRHRL